VIVAGLVGWAAWTRWQFLQSSPYPFGVDGYYYAIQLRSLLETGHLYYPASPLVMYWMLPFAAVAGPIAGAKLAAALGTALLAVPAYLLGRRISGQRAIGLLCAALAATSAEASYHAFEFIKQGVALTLVTAYLAALLWALDRPNRRRIALAAALLLAAALAHKTGAALGVLVSLPPLVAAAQARGWRPGLRDRATRIAAGAALLLLVVSVALAIAAPDAFLSADDLEPLRGLFSRSADWTLPALAFARPLYFGHEVAIAAALAAAALALLAAGRLRGKPVLADRPAHDRAVVVMPALLALFLALPWLDIHNPEGLGFRLRLLAFLPLVLAAALVAGAGLRGLPPLVRAGLAVGFAVGWVASRPATPSEGLVDVDPDMRAAVLAADGVVPEGDWIICPQRSLMFMTTYEIRARVRLRPEPVAPERRWRLMPSYFLHPQLAHALDLVRRQQPEGIVLPRGLHPRQENAMVLMPERTWEWLMKQISPALRREYQEWRTL
jgi:hypothetical protein